MEKESDAPEPPKSVHVKGNSRGEEQNLHKSREPGRGEKNRGYRSARDSTSINSEARGARDPDSIDIPPA